MCIHSAFKKSWGVSFQSQLSFFLALTNDCHLWPGKTVLNLGFVFSGFCFGFRFFGVDIRHLKQILSSSQSKYYLGVIFAYYCCLATSEAWHFKEMLTESLGIRVKRKFQYHIWLAVDTSSLDLVLWIVRTYQKYFLQNLCARYLFPHNLWDPRGLAGPCRAMCLYHLNPVPETSLSGSYQNENRIK